MAKRDDPKVISLAEHIKTSAQRVDRAGRDAAAARGLLPPERAARRQQLAQDRRRSDAVLKLFTPEQQKLGVLLEYLYDKTDWPRGAWDDEPDRMEWRYEGTPRLALLAVRNYFGAWCGYVGVPPGHPWHGVDGMNIDARVHGGVCFSARCDEGGLICHVPHLGESPDVWWVGFDCLHAFDLAPNLYGMDRIIEGNTYRDVLYIRCEVERLAEQAARVAKGLPLDGE